MHTLCEVYEYFVCLSSCSEIMDNEYSWHWKLVSLLITTICVYPWTALRWILDEPSRFTVVLPKNFVVYVCHDCWRSENIIDFFSFKKRLLEGFHINCRQICKYFYWLLFLFSLFVVFCCYKISITTSYSSICNNFTLIGAYQWVGWASSGAFQTPTYDTTTWPSQTFSVCPVFAVSYHCGDVCSISMFWCLLPLQSLDALCNLTNLWSVWMS